MAQFLLTLHYLEKNLHLKCPKSSATCKLLWCLQITLASCSVAFTRYQALQILFFCALQIFNSNLGTSSFDLGVTAVPVRRRRLRRRSNIPRPAGGEVLSPSSPRAHRDVCSLPGPSTASWVQQPHGSGPALS